MPKVLILAGDASESLEVMCPYQRLLEEGYEVHIAGPSKKKLQFVVHDFVDGYDTYTEKPGYPWDADVAFADVGPGDYVSAVCVKGNPCEVLTCAAGRECAIQESYPGTTLCTSNERPPGEPRCDP